MDTFEKQFAHYVEKINESLPAFLPEKNTPYDDVINAMQYSLCNGGKRIRGLFVLSFYQFFGGINIDLAMPFAAAMEMIHAYSLIHDDLPCMDDDDLRRGKPSCHIAYGESTALLAGDGLLTLAFETVTKDDILKNFSAKQVFDAVKTMSKAAGVSGMIGGQVMDLANEGKKISVQELRETDYKKTGALFISSALIGSILAGANVEEQKVSEIFARNIGLVFQMVDDILDVTSTEEELGKPIGSDQENKKQTYTTLYGVEETKKLAEELTNEAVSALISTGRDTSFLESLSKKMIDRTY